MENIVRFAVTIIFVLYSVSSSHAATTSPSGGGGGGGDAQAMPCIQKLMPCQPFLHSVIPPPPPSCCLPMREIVANDATCLCSVFNNVDMLKSLNLTKDNALDLPKACGANPDISLCKASPVGGTTTPSTSPATPKTPPVSSTGSGSTGASSASSTSTPTSSAPAINFAKLSFASTIVALATTVF
ncbi:Bifunctional inhibitor/lipid-transfer protein/seed storage 2S albumin superfamily protein [Raphanus sativus]|uniref:Non-specific lipid transfer protein GPI-anchored 3-like n=1 Tax=Raphanus sativus TaxID=3726 RepID=A0A6J0JQN1_RAPSA|nr:non-specific lipid transfer protein GPI-anchored 3-like [Raphanus sativus]KAJ4889447.1 Bifunctional inhibitor/lipid-transfer protein/seed storage 2S albumin superfamily protein [Raphanus sativus]